MSQPAEASPPPPKRPLRTAIRAAIAILALGLTAWGLWHFGRPSWEGYLAYREEQQAAEDSVPIGYIGTHFRRSYYDRPARFLVEEGGRKALWAAMGEGSQPEYYDVTDADLKVESLSGGFGRDSNPGIDYPIFERPDSDRGRRLRDRQAFYGLVLGEGPRAYPADLLKKVEVVNDRDGQTPFAVVFDRSRDEARFYDRRVDGREVTFGTTGYAYGIGGDPVTGKPLLYDRRTRSLWLPEDQALVCVNGALRRTKLPVLKTPEKTTWSGWHAQHPKTSILMGNDRAKPIPEE